MTKYKMAMLLKFQSGINLDGVFQTFTSEIKFLDITETTVQHILSLNSELETMDIVDSYRLCATKSEIIWYFFNIYLNDKIISTSMLTKHFMNITHHTSH